MADTANQRVAREIDNQMKAPIRQALLAPKLFAKQHHLKGGKTMLTFNQITETSDSIVSFAFPKPRFGDGIKTTPVTVKCAHHVNTYEIERDRADAFLSEGQDLPAENAISAAQKNAEKLETTLLMAWKPDGSTEKITGLYLAAGNTFGGSTFATPGNPIAAVAGAMGENSEDKVRGVNYNFTLHPTQFAELNGSVLASGDREKPQVLEMVNPIKSGPQGEILETTEMTAGTAMITPVDPSGVYMDLVVAHDFENVIGLDSRLGKYSPIFGTNLVTMAPRYNHVDGSGDTVAICSITGI